MFMSGKDEIDTVAPKCGSLPTAIFSGPAVGGVRKVTAGPPSTAYS
jgi:hypothetical protein